MERNAILFLVLSISIIIGYSVLFPPAPALEPPTQGSPVSPATTDSTTSPLMAEAPGALGAAGTADERTVVVETDVYRATLSTRGAVITSWRLSRYTDGPTNDSPIDLYTPPAIGGVSPLAVVLEGGDEASREAIQGGLYAVDGGDMRLGADRPTGTLKFETQGPNGERVVKRLTFYHDN
jgi:YidC/Oxa1 family membrane protein insertase